MLNKSVISDNTRGCTNYIYMDHMPLNYNDIKHEPARHPNNTHLNLPNGWRISATIINSHSPSHAIRGHEQPSSLTTNYHQITSINHQSLIILISHQSEPLLLTHHLQPLII